jgi:alkylation response protein AidB-like acyl-CoA dehydrogenase
VRVPQRYRIGEEGMGFTYQMQQFQEERLWGRAGWRKSAFIIEETIDYLRERQAFGKPLLDNQYMHYKLAELQTEVEALGACSTSGGAVRAGQDVTQLASMASSRRPAWPRGRRLVRAVLGRHGLHRGDPRQPLLARLAAGLDRRWRRRGDDGHHRQDHGHPAEGPVTMFDTC